MYFNDILCEELGLRHVLGTKGIIISIIRAALNYSWRNAFQEILVDRVPEDDITYSTLHTQLSHPAQYVTSRATQHKLSSTLHINDYVLHDNRVKTKTAHTAHINNVLYRVFL